ncbi:MAG: YhgE/Pip domain-containing protein, partial [Ancrocorticia populi]
MRNILGLIVGDVRRASQSVMAWTVVFGLVIIPSLFAWFNVLASWDPFGSTGNLKVAVANSDAGYQSDVVPIPINVGDQVLSELRANDDLDWIITSEEDALDGTRSGEYYAAIVLPESFSEDMLTFYAEGAERTHIDYYTNDKKNSVAPIITGQGADAVSAQINEVFTKTLGDVALGLVSSLSDFLSDGDTEAVLTNLESRLGDI